MKGMNNVRKLSLSGVMSAAGTVIMLAGSAYGRADIFTAILASVCVAVVLEHCKTSYATASFLTITVLSFLFCNFKTAPFLFAFYLGYFPILKKIAEEKLPLIKAYILKALVMNFSLAVLVFIAKSIVNIKLLPVIVLFLGANIVLPIYDRAVTVFGRNYINFVNRRK